MSCSSSPSLRNTIFLSFSVLSSLIYWQTLTTFGVGISCKHRRTAICEHDPEMRRLLWAKPRLKWSEAKQKNVLWSNESRIKILFGNHGRCVLQTKEETDRPACYQRAASLTVWGCICGQLTHLEGNHQCWRVNEDFRETCNIFCICSAFFSIVHIHILMNAWGEKAFALERSNMWTILPKLKPSIHLSLFSVQNVKRKHNPQTEL